MRVHSSRKMVLTACALALGLTGCASSGGGSRPAGASSNRIVQAELLELTDMDAYQAVQRLRSGWLRPRGGGTPRLYINGARRSGLGDLRSYSANQIVQMELLNSSDATTRFGTGHQSGAILVQTR